jgi:hypothetical protein
MKSKILPVKITGKGECPKWKKQEREKEKGKAG